MADTMTVKDAAGAMVAIAKLLPAGRAPAAASRPVVLAEEDTAKLSAIVAALAEAVGRLSAALTVTGTVSVSNFPEPVSREVEGAIAVTNFPAAQAVTGQFWQSTQPVSISSLPSLPAGAAIIGAVAQAGPWAVSGSVDVSNLPSVQPVSGTFWPATQPVSGTVNVGNLPATQAVSGNVAVSNFPATQPVSGTFWQATQPVSAASLPLPAGAATETTLAAVLTKLGTSLAVSFPAATLVDRSGTIASASQAQTLMPANAARKGAFVQNLSAADLYINSLATAVVGQPSIRIAPGAIYEFPRMGVPTTAISIIGTALVAGQAFTAREWS